MKYESHIKLLKEVKEVLPMNKDYHGWKKSKYICDNLLNTPNSSEYGLRPYGDPVATEVKKLVTDKTNGEYSLLEFLGFNGTYEEGQQERQKFLDELIHHYERLNEQS